MAGNNAGPGFWRIPSADDVIFSPRAANLVFAGPATGSDALPTFRLLAVADIPSLSGIYQPLDSDLTAISALNSTGFARQAGAGTWSIVAETGSGSVVRATSPTLVTPILGTPASGTLTNCTGLPVASGISGFGTGIAASLAVNIGSAGAPVLFNGAGGTPSSMVGTNITGTASGLTAGNVTTNANLTGPITSVGNATAVASQTGTGSVFVMQASPTLTTPNIGTPSAGVLTNCTGLPISTGVSGLGAGVATFLATPSSANLRTAVTDETGSGALVFANSPNLIGPNVSGIINQQTNGGGTTPAGGLSIANTTAATDILPQYSPTLSFGAQGWDGAASEGVTFDTYVTTTAGSVESVQRTRSVSTSFGTLEVMTLTRAGAMNVTASVTSPSFVGALTGNASTATILATTRTIWGQNFNGSANVSGTLALGASDLTMTGSIAATGARVTKGWFTDIESTNMPTVGGVSLNSTFQPLDSDLTTIAGLTATTDNFIVSVSSAWASRTPAQVRTTLGLVIGTNVQAYDADLTTWAGITPGTGVGTALAVNVGTAGAFVVNGGALGTPSSGTLTNCTFPTLNQNTTGSAAKWTTARNLAGNSVDGSANVAFANKFIVQGTADSGLSAAQFLGALGTGIVKNTTTTGVLSIAVAGDFPTLNQNTTGSAATLTTARAIYGNNFDGSAALTQIIASTYGGTGNGFAKFSGPATSEKTFTLPNASATILTDNAAVTVAQGGTGRATSTTAYGLIAAGTTATGAHQTLAAGATTEILVGGGASALPVWTTATGSGSPVRATSPTLVTPILGAATATSLVFTGQGAGYEGDVVMSASSPYSIMTIRQKGGAGGWGGQIDFATGYSGGTAATVFSIRNTGTNGVANLYFGGIANRSTSNGESTFNIFNGTAPSGTLTNGASLYVTGGEMRVMDSAGNATLISPHDKDGNWIHDEINFKGRRLRVDMERMVKALDKLLGGGFVKEFLIEK